MNYPDGICKQCLCKSDMLASPDMEGTRRRKSCGPSSRSTGLTLDWRSCWGQKVKLLVFMMVLSLLPISIKGSCETGDRMDGHVPNDEDTLNKYLSHDEINSVEECVDICCRSDACDMVWMLEGRCYSVQCFNDATCRVTQSTEFTTTTVRIRHVPDYPPPSTGKDCIPGFDDCQYDEICRRDPTSGRNTCQCKAGLTRNYYGECVLSDGYESLHQTTPSQKDDLDDLRLCESDADCLEHEFCFGLELYDDGICASDALQNVPSSQQPPEQTEEPDLESTTPSEAEVQEETTADVVTQSFVDVPVKKGGSDTTNGTDDVSSGSITEESGNTSDVVQLTVSLGESKFLQLPDETSMSVHAYVIPDDPPGGQPYTYQYQVVTEPEGSSVEMTSTGQADPQVTFSQLTAGFYQFKVVVSGSRSYGTSQVNVTVRPPPRVNQPPVAIIQPAKQVVLLPNSDTILDGSGSTDDDDDRIASYSWNQVQGPLNDHEINGDQDTLQLTDLKPGIYLIRLTVTDFDGASNSTIANVTVREEEDYKPHAQAGPDIEIKLPVDFTTLNGSKSSDDHAITSYEWTKMVDKVADMTGSSTKILHLNGLEEGTYVFKLTVTDAKDQTDSDTATVIVKPEHNTPPTADAGPDKELTLPSDATTLDGSDSIDDQGIEGYHWEQVSGPSEAVLTNPDQAVVDVSSLQEGAYVFSLTVQDSQGISDSAQVTVSVKRERNQAPVAVVGPDQEITLPSTSLEVDGSQSSDDKGIVSYLWTRSNQSPAAGVVVGNSDHETILRIVDLVPGQYKFTLNVTDAKGAYGTDSTVVTVKEDPYILSRVQIVFDEEIKLFTEQDKNDLIMPLAVMLGVNNGDVVIQRVTLTDSGMLKVEFLAYNKTSHKPLPGPEVLKRLKSKDIMSQSALLKHSILQYDTTVCQKNCSNHGHCDPYSKRCVCETFWMENFFRVKFQDGESNCDWSILYVIIVCFLVLVALGVFIWCIVCCCARRKKKGRRRHRYTLLEDQENNDMMEMHPKMGNGNHGNVLDKLTGRAHSSEGKQSSSIMISESGEDSDDETTVFDIKRQDRNGSKPANGYATGKHRSNRVPHRTDKI